MHSGGTYMVLHGFSLTITKLKPLIHSRWKKSFWNKLGRPIWTQLILEIPIFALLNLQLSSTLIMGSMLAKFYVDEFLISTLEVNSRLHFKSHLEIAELVVLLARDRRHSGRWALHSKPTMWLMKWQKFWNSPFSISIQTDILGYQLFNVSDALYVTNNSTETYSSWEVAQLYTIF